MTQLSKEQVQHMAQAVGLTLPEPDINDVVSRLSALLGALEEMQGELGAALDAVEPVPPVYPHEDDWEAPSGA